MNKWTSQFYLKDEKIYRGSFNYSKNDVIYAEETFDVYRLKKDHNLAYISESIIKLPTGEILYINVEYVISKDLLPVFVMVEKSIGRNLARETYKYNIKNNTLDYTFHCSKNGDHNEIIALAPRYHIATPTAATTILFIKTKKFDSNGKNYYNILQSQNHWDFREVPSFKLVLLERENVSMEKLIIESQEVLATVYKLYEDLPDMPNGKKHPHITIHLSPHASIPYLVTSEDGVRIQIKYLNDLGNSQ